MSAVGLLTSRNAPACILVRRPDSRAVPTVPALRAFARSVSRDHQDGPSDFDVWCVVCRLPETRCWHYDIQQQNSRAAHGKVIEPRPTGHRVAAALDPLPPRTRPARQPRVAELAAAQCLPLRPYSRASAFSSSAGGVLLS